MSAFDYGNARIRVMKSRLLSRPVLETLAGVGNVRALLNALTKTAYQTAVEKALVQESGLAALNRALREDLVSTVSRIPGFFTDSASPSTRKIVSLAIGRYDVDNVKTVLRGLSQRLAADEITANTLPVGNLTPVDLATLARAENVWTAIDLLVTWRLPLAHPLLTLRGETAGESSFAERPSADLFEMELALERWYFAQGTADIGHNALSQMIRLEADITNILTVLRLVDLPEAGALLEQRFGAADITLLFVGPGRIPFDLLRQAASQATVPESVARLAATPYQDALIEARQQYSATRRLSLFELALAGHRLRHAARLFISDPLGIGVFVGYLALKTAEVANLRRIAQGLELGEPAEVIRAGLIGN